VELVPGQQNPWIDLGRPVGGPSQSRHAGLLDRTRIRPLSNRPIAARPCLGCSAKAAASFAGFFQGFAKASHRQVADLRLERTPWRPWRAFEELAGPIAPKVDPHAPYPPPLESYQLASRTGSTPPPNAPSARLVFPPNFCRDRRLPRPAEPERCRCCMCSGATAPLSQGEQARTGAALQWRRRPPNRPCCQQLARGWWAGWASSGAGRAESVVQGRIARRRTHRSWGRSTSRFSGPDQTERTNPCRARDRWRMPPAMAARLHFMRNCPPTAWNYSGRWRWRLRQMLVVTPAPGGAAGALGKWGRSVIALWWNSAPTVSRYPKRLGVVLARLRVAIAIQRGKCWTKRSRSRR